MKLMLKDSWELMPVEVDMISMSMFIQELELTSVEKRQVSLKV
jgi:hypothetical protein